MTLIRSQARSCGHLGQRRGQAADQLLHLCGGPDGDAHVVRRQARERVAAPHRHAGGAQLGADPLPDGQGERVRAELRAGGVAVRRGDTFPGLSPDHVRVAVRSAAQVQQLVRGLATALAEVPA